MSLIFQDVLQDLRFGARLLARTSNCSLPSRNRATRRAPANPLRRTRYRRPQSPPRPHPRSRNRSLRAHLPPRSKNCGCSRPKLLYRESLARMLSSENNFELVAECTTSAEAVKRVKGSEVDVVLVDSGIANDFMACARRARYSGKSLVIAREIDATGSAMALKFG